jgi:hypothetical protein
MRRQVGEPQIETLTRFLDIGVGIFVATAFTVLKFPRFGELYKTNPTHAVFSMALFITTCAWLFGWLYFDYQEVQFFRLYIDTDRKKIGWLKLSPFISMLIIGVVSGVLLGLSDQPRFFIIAASINLLVGFVGQKNVDKHFKLLNQKFETYKKGPKKAISDYYLKSSFQLLDIIAFAFLAVALVLAWNAFITSNQFNLYMSYSIIIITIIIHEGVLWKWRIKRDRTIDRYEQAELKRNNEKENEND